MRFSYLSYPVQRPIPALGGRFARSRPVIPVRMSGPAASWLMDGQLDTGADETICEEWVASAIGIDLTNAPRHDVRLVGRTQPVQCRYRTVQIRVTDGVLEALEWTGIVGFVNIRLRFPLLGFAGFLEYLDVEFRGPKQEVEMKPGVGFPGQVVRLSKTP
ncbi:MAG: hypothetical protein FJ271_09020 [Planctomycetes bacterium]|nr:hypothetical protein [Planctomycetota bacterium]